MALGCGVPGMVPGAWPDQASREPATGNQLRQGSNESGPGKQVLVLRSVTHAEAARSLH